MKLAAALLASAALGASGGWTVRAWLADRDASRVRAEAASLREEALHAALVETTRRMKANEEAAQKARTQAGKARADAAAARSAADSLRDAASQTARACGDPATPGGGAADRLADVLAEAVREASRMAEAADRAVVAGLACEAAYDGLR